MTGVTREHVRLIDYVEPQGVTVTRTTKGLLFRFPNGATEMVHFTQSDYRAMRNVRANFRRNGIEWPGDVASRGNKKPMKSTVARMRTYLDTIDKPEAGLQIQALMKASGISFYSCESSLRELGWWKGYGLKGRWYPPLDDPKQVVEEVVPTLTIVPDEPESTDQPAGREFLDSVDSWCVDLAAVDPTVTLAQLVSLYAGAGLSIELRIWKS